MLIGSETFAAGRMHWHDRPGKVRVMDAGTALARSPEVEAAIRRRAERLYEQRGRTPGHQVEDWLQAEAEVLREIELARAPKPAFVAVRFAGAVYTGEYDANHSDGYSPGEFRTGSPVEIRFAADRMYVKRPNGKELEARIVRKGIENSRL